MNKSICFKVKFQGPTNTLGSRVALINYDVRHRTNDRPKTKSFSWDYSIGRDSSDQAKAILTKAGFELESLIDMPDHYLITAKWDWSKLCAFYGMKEEV